MSNVSLVNGHIDRPKLTDEQIIKALECCITNDCAKCKAYDETNGEMVDCLHAICRNALDLINRQKAEIEKLENIERIATKTIETQSAEIERLKNSIKEADNYFSKGEMGKGLSVIINLVKEMVGDEK